MLLDLIVGVLQRFSSRRAAGRAGASRHGGGDMDIGEMR